MSTKFMLTSMNASLAVNKADDEVEARQLKEAITMPEEELSLQDVLFNCLLPNKDDKKLTPP